MPQYDALLGDLAPKATDTSAPAAGKVIDMQELLSVEVLAHTTFHVRVVSRRGALVLLAPSLIVCLTRLRRSPVARLSSFRAWAKT